MVRQLWFFAALAVVALFLQTALLPWVLPRRTTVDLLLVLCVYLGLRHHSPPAIGAAFALGYLEDAVSGTLAGLNAAAMLAVYWVIYRTSRHLWVDNALSQVAAVFLGGVVKNAVVLLALAWFQGGEEWWRVSDRLFLSVVLTALAGPLVFRVLRLFQEVLGSSGD